MSTHSNYRSVSVFLTVCALAFAAIGINTFIDPLSAMAPLNLDVNTPGALNELRANYGGMQLGMAVLLALGLLKPALRHPALVAQALLVGGLAAGRLVSWSVDGVLPQFNAILLGVEVATALLSVVGLCVENKKVETQHVGA